MIFCDFFISNNDIKNIYKIKVLFKLQVFVVLYSSRKLAKINFGFNCAVLARSKKYKVFVYYYVMHKVFDYKIQLFKDCLNPLVMSVRSL